LKTNELIKDLLFLLFKLKMVLYSVDSPQKIGQDNHVVGQKTPKAGYFHLIAVKNYLSKINNTPYIIHTSTLVNLEEI
jgi:hypothetical protein